MSNSTPRNQEDSLLFIRSGLGRTLFLWFLGLALIPLAFVSWRDYSQAVDVLRTMTVQRLSETLELKTNILESFFVERINDLKILAHSRDNIKFFSHLSSVWQAGKIPLELFVQSVAWADLVEREAGELKDYVDNSHRKNLLFMEPGGAVLFAVHPDALLGTNLLTGPLKDSRAGEAVRKAIAERKIVFSDLEHQDSAVPSAYLVCPMVAEHGETIGALLLQVNLFALSAIMENNTGLGETGETFLLGRDQLMRSNARFVQHASMREVKVDTELTRQWVGEDVARETARLKGAPAQQDHQVRPQEVSATYRDYRGVEVLGIYFDLDFLDELGVHWVMIAKMDVEEFFAPSIQLRNRVLIALLLILVLVLVVAWGVARHIVTPLRHLTRWAEQIQSGALTMVSIQAPDNELGTLVDAFAGMTTTLIATDKKNQQDLWLKEGAAALNEHLRGERIMTELAGNMISFLATFLGAQAGVLYATRSRGEGMVRCGSFALPLATRAHNIAFAPGVGLVGQCLVEKKPLRIHPVPAGYFRIQSGLGEAEPRHLLLFPFLLNDRVEAMVELGAFDPFTDLHLEFLAQEAKGIAMAVAAAQSRALLRETLERSQAQAQELQRNSEALRHSNEELQAQSQALQASEALLQQQQEELRVSNEELEAHAQILEEKNIADQRKNEALQVMRQALEQKAFALEQASRYKSEFLSNMSHELRTPLNSLLILANSFAQNEDGNLTARQVEDAQIIHASGKDLLGLINEILDLAKIEAGRMDLHVESVTIQDLAQDLERHFRHVADQRGVAFMIDMADAVRSETLHTDQEKVVRILKNLLSNAFKFTSQGRVTLRFAPPPVDWRPTMGQPGGVPGGVAMAVIDTGIGIPENKQATIFEAFRQADGSTSRQYGGTGLGLTISTQLAHLLGGEIRVASTEGVGSTFTLLLPWQPGAATPTPAPSAPMVRTQEVAGEMAGAAPSAPAIEDDRAQMQPGERVMLIIEDDPTFARLVAQFAHEQGFKCLAAADGQTGLELACRQLPTGIILDIGLPVLDGWSVLEQLKANPLTRHIPVHIMSAADLGVDGLTKGAASQFAKPVSKADIQKALSATDHLATQPPGPVVSAAGKGGTDTKVLDEVALFLHRVECDLPPEQRQIIPKLHNPAEVFQNKTILLVDDNARNAHALARQLERKSLTVRLATNGEEALAAIEQYADIDCVLMDIMMPVMDGYEAMRRIRQQPRHRHLPLIALTAKAMEEDRRCALEAGANDYLAKPVDVDKLLAMLKIWLYHTL
ncbi:MAG: response regulator [Magnetococcales bacterium]|nr:response regulator [Magnetococcales bacterium]